MQVYLQQMRHWHGDLLRFQERGSREDCERVDARRYGKENEEIRPLT